MRERFGWLFIGRVTSVVWDELRNVVVKLKRAQRERIMYGVSPPLNADWQEHPLRQIQQNA